MLKNIGKLGGVVLLSGAIVLGLESCIKNVNVNVNFSTSPLEKKVDYNFYNLPSGKKLYLNLQKENEKIIWKVSRKENKKIPKVYLDIVKNYGQMDSSKFLKLHKSYLDSEKEIFIGINETSKIKNDFKLNPVTPIHFAKFLENNREDLLKEYTQKYRKNGFGGCYPISRKVYKSLSNFKIFSVTNFIPGHFHNLVNIDGIAYYVDFTFNQFVENTSSSPYGPPSMKGKTTGLIVMPLGIIK